MATIEGGLQSANLFAVHLTLPFRELQATITNHSLQEKTSCLEPAARHMGGNIKAATKKG
eukprot:5053137-Amphidinium_carterae.1